MNEFDGLSTFYERLMSYNGIDEWKGYVVNTIKRYLKNAKDIKGIDIGYCTTNAVPCKRNRKFIAIVF